MDLQLLSVQVGLPVTYPPVEPDGKPWRSAIVKTAVTGPVWVRALGLDGDAQSDKKHHGGPSRAVNVYPAEHYETWRAIPGLEGMGGGAFGENFTTLGLVEQTACIGDVFAVGEAVVEITQPRGPCYKLNRRWNKPDLQSRSEDEHRFGWYLRVRQEGRVQPGDAMRLLEHPFPEWPIARVWDVTIAHNDPETMQALIACPALSPEWKETLQKLLDRS